MPFAGTLIVVYEGRATTAVFTDLIDSAREIRSPLAIGYSLLFSSWLSLDHTFEQAFGATPLGQRLDNAFEGLGDATSFAIVTFVAAMLGSLVWNLGVERLIAYLQHQLHHPDWGEWIASAQRAVRDYEEYRVTTLKSAPNNTGAEHKVISPHWGQHLQAEADARARKASEVEFRMTLAIALLPVAITLGVEGGRWWWGGLLLPVLVWIDVSTIKYSTRALLSQYKRTDLLARRDYIERALARVMDDTAEAAAARRAELIDSQGKVDSELRELHLAESRRASRVFAWLRGTTRAAEAHPQQRLF